MIARKAFTISALCLLTAAVLWPDAAAARQPLLVEGKRSLYQRVITHPDAQAYAGPMQAQGRPVKTFTPFYVYGRSRDNGEEWLEVSPSTQGDSTVWIRGTDCSRWDKALSMMFTERMGRDPVLFFNSFDELNRLVSSDSLAGDIDMFLAQHKAGKAASGSPLLAVEPQTSAVPRNQFYLMPIFDYSLEYDQYNLKLLKVGCINPGKASVPKPKIAASKNFSAGIAFVVDTTISMRPYIDETKRFIINTYEDLKNSKNADKLYLGIVAFRNSTKFNPKIEYVSRVIAPLTPLSGLGNIADSLNDFDECQVSTHSFNEDAFAGIMSAIENLSWSPHAIKLVVLITDAGAIRNSDKFSSTKLNEDEIRDLLAQKGIRLLVVHLQTPAGKRHQPAKTERQYKTLTSVADKKLKSVYIKLRADNSQTASRQFGKLSDSLVKVIMKVIDLTAAGKQIRKPEAFAPATPEDSAAQIAERIGYAAQLEFVGGARATQAPEMLEAWAVDKDLVSLADGSPTEALNVTVLLNKRQLDSLGKQLQLVLDAAKSSRDMDSGQLFERLVSLSAQTVRDPSLLHGKGVAANLAELGVLPEFLEDLPYKSWIMSLTPEAWSAMNSTEQDAKIRDLEAKLQLYREYHNDVSNWMSFGTHDPAEALYRVPLTSLP